MSIVNDLFTAGNRLEKANIEQEAARADVWKLIKIAKQQGMSNTRIAITAKVARQTVYNVLDKKSPEEKS